MAFHTEVTPWCAVGPSLPIPVVKVGGTDHGRAAEVRRGAAVTAQALVNVFGSLYGPNAVRDHRRLLWPVTGPALQRRTGVGDGRGLKLLAQGATGAQPTGGRCIKG